MKERGVTDNQLLLNPRMPSELRLQLTRAWQDLVDTQMSQAIGIATSGSSGDTHGRLIVLSREALECSAQAVNRRLQAHGDDVWFKILPDFHVGGLGIKVRAALAGARVVESQSLAKDQVPRWNAAEFYSELLSSRATLLSLVPTQVFDLVRAGFSAPSSVRAVIVGGGRLEESLLNEACRLGWPVLVSYGLTECSSQVATALQPGEQRLWPLDHVELRIAENQRLEIRSAALLSGQITFIDGKPELLRHQAGHWLSTEDIGRLDQAGSLAVLGRAGDFLKIGGEGVSMGRLEDCLVAARTQIGFCGDAAIVAARDPRLGAAVILLAVGDKESVCKLHRRYNDQVMPFERIRDVYYLDELPRSPLGKLLRRQALAMVGCESVLIE